jgi:Domain of unknown function (DUF1905)/Bacteriocin-protection, YdeI or OmpD-Associated
MKRAPKPQQLAFQSRLERIASGAEYFALSVPLKISRALQTRGPVPVSARVNDSMPFLVSLFPIGGGRHYLRVKATVRNAAKIKGGDRVRVHLTVLDRSAVSLPQDLTSALRAQGALESFQALPLGQQRYTIRRIDEAAKPETRDKRIQIAVAAARPKKTIGGTKP